MRTITLIMVLCLNLAACGQKGDLYLPDDKPTQQQGDASSQQQSQSSTSEPTQDQ